MTIYHLLDSEEYTDEKERSMVTVREGHYRVVFNQGGVQIVDALSKRMIAQFPDVKSMAKAGGHDE